MANLVYFTWRPELNGYILRGARMEGQCTVYLLKPSFLVEVLMSRDGHLLNGGKWINRLIDSSEDKRGKRAGRACHGSLSLFPFLLPCFCQVMAVATTHDPPVASPCALPFSEFSALIRPLARSASTSLPLIIVQEFNL